MKRKTLTDAELIEMFLELSVRTAAALGEFAKTLNAMNEIMTNFNKTARQYIETVKQEDGK